MWPPLTHPPTSPPTTTPTPHPSFHSSTLGRMEILIWANEYYSATLLYLSSVFWTTCTMCQSYFLFFVLFTLIYCLVRLVNHLGLLGWKRALRGKRPGWAHQATAAQTPRSHHIWTGRTPPGGTGPVECPSCSRRGAGKCGRAVSRSWCLCGSSRRCVNHAQDQRLARFRSSCT